MSMERSRRDRFSTHRVPLSWEVPVAVLGAGAFVILITPLVVQGVVGWATAGDLAWPAGHLLDAYGGLLGGTFGGGLPGHVAAGLPPDPVMWVLTVASEVLVLAASVILGARIRDLAGADSRHGLATSTRAADALGLRGLRTSAPEIRPDLYAPGHRTRVGGGKADRLAGRSPWPAA